MCGCVRICACVLVLVYVCVYVRVWLTASASVFISISSSFFFALYNNITFFFLLVASLRLMLYHCRCLFIAHLPLSGARGTVHLLNCYSKTFRSVWIYCHYSVTVVRPHTQKLLIRSFTRTHFDNFQIFNRIQSQCHSDNEKLIAIQSHAMCKDNEWRY